MNKRILGVLIGVIGVGVFSTACSLGKVDMNSSSSSHKETPSEASSRKVSESKQSKRDAAASKSASIQALGKQYRYGLPQGPSWLQVYEKNKPTGVNLSPTKQNVVTLHENSNYHYAGTLPWVGALSGATRTVGGSKATIDNSSSYQYDMDADRFNQDVTFEPFTNANPKTISSHAFADLKQYYKAVNDRNASELPSSSSELKSLWGETGIVIDSGALRTHYDVQKQYFDRDSMKVSPNSNGYSNSTHVEVLFTTNDDNEKEYTTKLYVPTFVQMKETDVAKEIEGGRTNKDFGKSTTSVM